VGTGKRRKVRRKGGKVWGENLQAQRDVLRLRTDTRRLKREDGERKRGTGLEKGGCSMDFGGGPSRGQIRESLALLGRPVQSLMGEEGGWGQENKKVRGGKINLCRGGEGRRMS